MLCVGFVVQEGLLEVNAAVLVASLRSFYGPSLELVVRARPHWRTCGGLRRAAVHPAAVGMHAQSRVSCERHLLCSPPARSAGGCVSAVGRP